MINTKNLKKIFKLKALYVIMLMYNNQNQFIGSMS
jgi:hypothetical protein